MHCFFRVNIFHSRLIEHILRKEKVFLKCINNRQTKGYKGQRKIPEDAAQFDHMHCRKSTTELIACTTL